MSAAPAPTVTRNDLEAKFRELRGEVETTTDSVKGYAIAAGVVVVTAVVVTAFLFGKRRGRKKKTIVEVRRF